MQHTWNFNKETNSKRENVLYLPDKATQFPGLKILLLKVGLVVCALSVNIICSHPLRIVSELLNRQIRIIMNILT